VLTSWSTRPSRLGGQSGSFSSDEDFMYGRSFQDVDGHLWEVLYMDPTAVQAQD